jgi:hypothetical protein
VCFVFIFLLGLFAGAEAPVVLIQFSARTGGGVHFVILKKHHAALVEIVGHRVGVVFVIVAGAEQVAQPVAVVLLVQRDALAAVHAVVQAVPNARLGGAVCYVVLVEFDHFLFLG